MNLNSLFTFSLSTFSLFTFSLFTFSLFTSSLSAQTVADFENFGLEVDTFLNNAEPDGAFNTGNISLINNFNPQFQSWDGWAISTDTDDQTPGFMNQYSSITADGWQGSLTYGVSYAPFGSIIELTGQAAGGVMDGFYITNSTYAYLSMRDGDAFAKKFGGPSGDDPDFFLLTIKKYLNGELSSDSIDFYLADYRFTDNSQDYILDEWTWVDLQPLGPADSLLFTLSSSDVGAFGMNTPAYFCIDDFTTLDDAVSSEHVAPVQVKVFPNPTQDRLHIHWPYGQAEGLLVGNRGERLKNVVLQSGLNQLSLGSLPAGIYQLVIEREEALVVSIVKK